MRSIFKSKRGMVGIEAAIVLIAFVIVAAAFSFMVVNMGLYATQRGREVIQEGIKEAGCPLTIDGSIIVRAHKDGGKADAIIIPLKVMGTKWVAMWKNETAVSLKVGNKAYPNIYQGVNKLINNFHLTSKKYDDLISVLIPTLYTEIFNESLTVTGEGTTQAPYTGKLVYTPVVPGTVYFNDTNGGEICHDAGNTSLLNPDETQIIGSIDYDTGAFSITGSKPASADYKYVRTGASLFIENSDGDDALNYYEKGFLIIYIGEGAAPARENVLVEIRPEKGAPLTIEFVIPEALPSDAYVVVG